MFIKLIKQIIPSPNLNVSFDRNEINAKLGINLPDDYYDLVAIYGAGTFANFIKILVPFSNEFEYSLFQFMEIDREDYSYGRDFLELDVNNEDFDDPRLQKGWKVGEPFGYYPEKGGLIPWGKSPFGTEYTFYWNTSNEQWSVVVYDDLYGYKEFSMTMTEFLYNLLSNKIGLGNTFTEDSLLFVPFTEQ